MVAVRTAGAPASLQCRRGGDSAFADGEQRQGIMPQGVLHGDEPSVASRPRAGQTDVAAKIDADTVCPGSHRLLDHEVRRQAFTDPT